MRSSTSARAGVGASPESPGSSSHVATHSPSRSDHDVRNEYAGISDMARVLRGVEQTSHLVRLHASGRPLLQVQRREARVTEDAVPAHLADLLVAELADEPQRLVEAERLRRLPGLRE